MTKKYYSNSFLQAYAKCGLMGHYQFDLHLVPREGDSHHLVYGRAMHEAFKVLYLENDLKKAQAVLRACYPKQIDLEDLAKTADNGCFTLEAYIKEYNWDKEWKLVAVEEMDHGEDDYVVKLDLVVENIRTGNLYGVDHKFTGRYLNADFWNEFNPNSQVTQYYKYIKEKYGRCDGFIINAVGMRYRQRAHKGEPAGFWCAFERLILNRSQQQIRQDTISRNDWIADIERSRETGIYRMNTASCRFCSYRQACAAGWTWEEDSELILTHYRQVCDKWVEDGGFHCRLDLGHEGAHSPEEVVEQVVEFEVEV